MSSWSFDNSVGRERHRWFWLTRHATHCTHRHNPPAFPAAHHQHPQPTQPEPLFLFFRIPDHTLGCDANRGDHPTNAKAVDASHCQPTDRPINNPANKHSRLVLRRQPKTTSIAGSPS